MRAKRPRTHTRRSRTRASFAGVRHGGYLGLALVVAGVTVVVPALLAPAHRTAHPAAHRPEPLARATTPAPALPVPATPSTSSATATPVRSSAPPSLGCVPSTPGSAPVQDAARPSCGLYQSALGTGWQVAGTGAKVAPGEQAPGSTQPAIRVDRRERAASVTFTAATPVTLSPGAVLRLRLYGGRQYGTVLRISASADTTASSVHTVTAQAGPQQWSDIVVDLSGFDLHAIRRIDMVVATEQLPQTYHFFLDDLVLAP